MKNRENLYYIPMNADLILPTISKADNVQLVQIGDGFYQPVNAEVAFKDVALLPRSLEPGEGIPRAWRKPVRWYPFGLVAVAVVKAVRTSSGIQSLRILAVAPE